MDKHPERRMKAAYKAFEEIQLPILKAENPNLRLSQLKQMLKKDWVRSPDNPLNQRTATYNAKWTHTSDHLGELSVRVFITSQRCKSAVGLVKQRRKWKTCLLYISITKWQIINFFFFFFFFLGGGGGSGGYKLDWKRTGWGEVGNCPVEDGTGTVCDPVLPHEMYIHTMDSKPGQDHCNNSKRMMHIKESTALVVLGFCVTVCISTMETVIIRLKSKLLIIIDGKNKTKTQGCIFILPKLLLWVCSLSLN